jgi:hypothetical protein
MLGRVDPPGRVGVVLEADVCKGLMDAAVREELDVAITGRAVEPGRVEEDDGEEEDEPFAKSVERDPADFFSF